MQTNKQTKIQKTPKPFLPANQKYLRFPPRNSVLGAKASPSSGIHRLLIGQHIKSCVDLWIVELSHRAAESRFPKGEWRSSPGHRHHPSRTDRMESGGEAKVWAQCQESGKSLLTRPIYSVSGTLLSLYTSHTTYSHNSIMMLCGSFYYPVL